MRVIILSSCPGFVLDGGVLGPKLLILLPSAEEGLVPPVFLIPRVINHMKLGREQGTLIKPFGNLLIGGRWCLEAPGFSTLLTGGRFLYKSLLFPLVPQPRIFSGMVFRRVGYLL